MDDDSDYAEVTGASGDYGADGQGNEEPSNDDEDDSSDDESLMNFQPTFSSLVVKFKGMTQKKKKARK